MSNATVTDRCKAMHEYIDLHKDEMVKTFEKLITMESGTKDKEDVDAVGKYLLELFTAEGFECKLVDVGSGGDTLVGILGKEREGKPVIFTGHMDTVFDKGTIKKNPFRIDENGHAHGPGVLDMKSGILISYYVIKALNEVGFEDRPIKILFSGNEECIHENSTGMEIMYEEGKDGLCAFNMETGLIGREICIGRKGATTFRLKVCGKSAHSGAAYLNGRNAVVEAANKIIKLHEITNLEEGYTVSPDVVHGGTKPNIIAEECLIECDCRVKTLDQLEKIKKRINEIAAESVIEGTTCEVSIVNEMYPFEINSKTDQLYEFVADISEEIGQGRPGSMYVGGASDASNIQRAGTPVICSMGVIGEHNHTFNEYAIVESLFDRAKLLTAVVDKIKEFKIKGE